MRFVSLALLSLLSFGGLVACGGGGGTEPVEPSAPGVLRTLALEGLPAPETTGDFAAFQADVPMDVAQGGWSVFVANTTDASAARCAYVAQPSGALLLAFRTGETVPDAGGGTLSDIDAVWITSTGRVLAAVAITGDSSGRTAGLLSARVSGGAVVDKHDVLYDQRPMADVGLTGTLDVIRDELAVLTGGGWVFVPVVTSAAEEALLRVAVDGTALTALVRDGDALAGGDSFLALEALAVDPIGSRYVFVAERDDNSRGIYIGVVGVAALYGQVFEEGDDLSEGVATLIPAPQPLLIDEGGRVLFKAVSSENADHLCVGSSVAAPAYLAVEGEADLWTEGLYQDLDWAHNARGTTFPFFIAELGTNPNGISFGIFLLTDLAGGTALAMWDTRNAPAGFGAAVRFTSTYPGLSGAGRRDADTAASLAFANVLNNGQPGVFWLLPNSGLYTIAAGGQTIPGGGDTFGGLSTWRTTTALEVMLFRAPVVGAGSGIFRRGP